MGKGTEGKSTTQTGCCEAKHTHITNKRVQTGKRAEGKALHKPVVCEANHTNITNTRVQMWKGAEGKSTTQTHCLLGKAHQHNK